MYKDQSARFLIKLLIPSLVIIWTGSAVADAVPYDIFGNIHVSLNSQDSVGNPEFTSNTSTLGIKGARKLPDHGLKLMFKAEWQYETTERVQEKSLVDRDQWVGVKGGFGTVLVGTATSNYKKTSSKVDPLWRTQLEGRSSFMQTSSRTLAAGAGIDRGRLTNSVNYKTPKMSGFQVAFNTTFSGADDESTGIGLRHSTKTTFFFVDMFSDGDVAGQSETATKVVAS